MQTLTSTKNIFKRSIIDMLSGEKIKAYSMFISNQRRQRKKKKETKEQVQRIENNNQ